MKKIISLCLSIIIITLSLPIEINAQESHIFDIKNFDNPELNLTEFTIEDLAKMTVEEYSQLIKEFERVYDPFDTYEQAGLSGTTEANLNSLGGISDGNLVSPAWTSGNYNQITQEYTESGTHEAITAAACGIMINDRGFYSNVESSSVAIVLYISLASILPDRDLSEIGILPYAGHFYNPITGKNWAGGAENTARNNAEERYNTALEYAQEGNMEKAYEYLGRSLHYIQDLNVPHHAANVTSVDSDSHAAFEQFAENSFDLCMGGYNSIGDNNYDYYPERYDVGSIAHLAAYYAYQRIEYVNDENDVSNWYNQARIGLRNAARYSVMVMYKFANEDGVPFYANQ